MLCARQRCLVRGRQRTGRPQGAGQQCHACEAWTACLGDVLTSLQRCQMFDVIRMTGWYLLAGVVHVGPVRAAVACVDAGEMHVAGLKLLEVVPHAARRSRHSNTALADRAAVVHSAGRTCTCMHTASEMTRSDACPARQRVALQGLHVTHTFLSWFPICAVCCSATRHAGTLTAEHTRRFAATAASHHGQAPMRRVPTRRQRPMCQQGDIKASSKQDLVPESVLVHCYSMF
jgi:hypothetical protein